jgi:hypothetical protein
MMIYYIVKFTIVLKLGLVKEKTLLRNLANHLKLILYLKYVNLRSLRGKVIQD